MTATDTPGTGAAAGAGTVPGRVQTLGEMARADGVRFLLATFTTLTGKPCSKLVPVSAADRMQDAGVGFAGYAAGAMGQQPRDPDLVAIPDVSSYTPLTFLRPGLGMVHCDPHVDGVPHPFAPRVVLRRALEAAAGEGVRLKVGTEVEYFLLVRDATGALLTADPRDTADRPCYDSRAVTRMYEHLTAVSDAMDSLGWGPYASDHEDGNGQFEQNFAYDDAMVTADRVVTLRYVLQVLAEQRGMTATFMPKPFGDRTGNGMHMHLSLWDGDRPLFPAGDSPDPYGLGLGAAGYGFVAGLLEHAPAMHAVLAPTVNSYKRTGATTTTSGATWAPRFASYGGDDRTHMLRVPDGDRVELRAPTARPAPTWRRPWRSARGWTGSAAAWTRAHRERRGTPPRSREPCSRRSRRSRATRWSAPCWTTTGRPGRPRGCRPGPGSRRPTPTSSATSSTPTTRWSRRGSSPGTSPGPEPPVVGPVVH